MQSRSQARQQTMKTNQCAAVSSRRLAQPTRAVGATAGVVTGGSERAMHAPGVRGGVARSACYPWYTGGRAALPAFTPRGWFRYDEILPQRLVRKGGAGMASADLAVGFLGAGQMATALARGWLAAGLVRADAC